MNFIELLNANGVGVVVNKQARCGQSYHISHEGQTAVHRSVRGLAGISDTQTMGGSDFTAQM